MMYIQWVIDSAWLRARKNDLHLRPLSFPFASPRHWPDLGVPLFAPHLVSACLIKGAFDESPLRKNRNFA